MRFTPTLPAALVAVLAASTALADTPGGDATLVHTTMGWLRGAATDAALEWRGIPYALPPVGDRRFRPTEAASSWADWPGWRDRLDSSSGEAIYRATERGSSCVQPFDDGPHGSEDCLYLNVFAPPDARAGAALPVFVHLHGGGNFWGSGEDDGGAFVSRGVIVVTLNYRLGVMGLLAHPALTAEGGGSSSNYLLWDQLAALAWVRDNIAGFGGDPSNVTLGGMSAGAGDVVALVAIDAARRGQSGYQGLFQRATPHAIGNYWINGFDSALATREAIGEGLAAGVGCGSGVADAAACLRAVPAGELVMAMGGNDWGPTTDGALLAEPVLDQILHGGPTVPLLIGHNREEDSFALFGFAPDPLSWSSYVHLANDLVGAQLGQSVRDLYPASDYDGSLYWALTAMTSDAAHGCPVRRVANATRNTTYRYLFTHVLENPDFWWAAALRAYHTAEYDLLWHGEDYAYSDEERALVERMRDYWTSFMKTGDPNATPGARPAWPVYDPIDERTMVLDTTQAVVSRYRAGECAVFDTTPIGPSCNTAICRYITRRLEPSGGWHPVFEWFFPLLH